MVLMFSAESSPRQNPPVGPFSLDRPGPSASVAHLLPLSAAASGAVPEEPSPNIVESGLTLDCTDKLHPLSGWSMTQSLCRQTMEKIGSMLR